MIITHCDQIIHGWLILDPLLHVQTSYWELDKSSNCAMDCGTVKFDNQDAWKAKWNVCHMHILTATIARLCVIVMQTLAAEVVNAFY